MIVSSTQNTLAYRQEKFARSASTYHLASEVQKSMAKQLIKLLKGFALSEFPLSHLEKGVELACGTGHLTELLLEELSNVQWTISDGAESMLTFSQQRFSKNSIHWELLDAMNFKFEQHCDLMASNALVQWLHPLESHLRCVWNSLNPNGYYLFSGFNRDNFPELRHILKKEPFSISLENGHTKEEVGDALEKVGFKQLVWFQESLEVHYTSTMHFLRSLKDFGGNGIPGFQMTRGKLNELKENYESKYSTERGVLVTWRPWYVLAQKVEVGVGSLLEENP